MPQAWVQMPLQVLIIHFVIDMKQLQNECEEGFAVGSFKRFKVVDTAIPYVS